MDFKDDIVAISTPSGMGAISVIRLTGDSPLKKVEPFFKSKKGTSLYNIKSHTLKYLRVLLLENVLSFFLQ